MSPTLQAWAESRVPDLFAEAVPELFYRPRDREWKRLIARLLDVIEEDPFDEVVASEEGIVKQVFLALRRYQPTLTEVEVARVLRSGQETIPHLATMQVGHILRLAWGRRPKDVLRSLIDGPSDGGGEADWPALYYKYITSVTGPAPRFEDLSISMFAAWKRAGRDGEDNREDHAEVAQQRRQFFKGIEE